MQFITLLLTMIGNLKKIQISPNNDQSRDDSEDGDHFIEQDDNFDECLLFLSTMHCK
jgi:hypothetical protein